MSLFAKVTLEVFVHLETDPGINTPDVYEMPYEYFAVRQVEAAGVEVFCNAHALDLIEQSGFDDHDPDGLIAEALTDALLSKQPTRQGDDA